MSVKIKIPKYTNVIILPEDCSILEDVTPDGIFIYKFIYYVDLTQNVFIDKRISPSYVQIDLLKNLVSKSSVNMFNNTDKTKLSINVLTQTSRQKDYIVNKEQEQILFSLKSDFTKKIPNDKIKDLTSKIMNKNGSFRQRIFFRI